MPWQIFAILTAFFESGKDVFGKQGLVRHDACVMAFAWRFFALPFLVPLLLYIAIPPLAAAFWWALMAGGTLNVVTAILYMQAIKASDLSVTVPMIAFTPLFLLITSPIFLGEFPGAISVAGIVLIVAGAYLLNIGQRSRGWLGPWRALLSERGPQLMLAVAFLWSISANIDKIGIGHSSPIFWAVAINTTIALGLLPLALIRWRGSAGSGGSWWILLATGFCGGMTSLCQMTAVSMHMVPAVIAVKRSSTVLSVLWGRLFFQERDWRERVVGVTIMFAGVLLITFDKGG